MSKLRRSRLACVRDPHCITHTYNSQLGIKEATGKNDGERVEQYLASVKLSKGYAWCAAFVNWCLKQCGINTINSAWCPAWFPPEKTIYIRGAGNNFLPQPGDVFGVWFPNLKRIAHQGFVHEWDVRSGYVITVEGNTNDALSRDGDGVYRKRRLIRQIYKVSRWKNTLPTASGG